MTNPDSQAEAKYDFENASEHIIEWLRHNLHAAQQDFEKKKIIPEMEIDEAFGTFDWDQKILPQEYRELQKKYFGKKGMSVFIGSFVWKDSLLSSTVNASAAPTSSAYGLFYTVLYCCNNKRYSEDINTLSAGELILQ